jgi:hypothetical protein
MTKRPRFLFLRVVVLGLAVVAASSCRRAKVETFDRALFQSPASEAVLKYVLENCPVREKARIAVVRIGPADDQPDLPFTERFVRPGLAIIPHERLRAGRAYDEIRIFDSQSGDPPLELQISELSAETNGVRTAVAAWSFIDQSERRRYLVKLQADGTHTVEPGDAIPIPHRNEDYKGPAK